MVLQVHKVGDEFTVVLPPQAVCELGVSDGDSVEIRKAPATQRYASPEEALRAYHETLPDHEAAYRELAK